MSLMEAYFNELSCRPLCSIQEELNQRIDNFVKVLSKVKEDKISIVRCSKENGISDIVLEDGFTLADFCNANPRGLKEILLMTMMRPPFFDEDSDENKTFNKGLYTLVTDENDFENHECIGLAAAILHDSYAVGFASSSLWSGNSTFKVKIEHDKGCQVCPVCCFSRDVHFNSEDHLNWLVGHTPENFISCATPANQKKCNLSSDHHGNHELKKFAKESLLVLSFVESVVTSLEYRPHCDRFVDGLQIESRRLELVLHWTEEGFGMVIQTTAQNELELRQMARKLEKKFGKQSH